MHDALWDKADSIIKAIMRYPALTAVVCFRLSQNINIQSAAGPWTALPSEGPDVWVRWPVDLMTLTQQSPRNGPICAVRPIEPSGWLTICRRPDGTQTQTPTSGSHDDASLSAAKANADRLLRESGCLVLDTVPRPPKT